MGSPNDLEELRERVRRPGPAGGEPGDNQKSIFCVVFLDFITECMRYIAALLQIYKRGELGDEEKGIVPKCCVVTVLYIIFHNMIGVIY